MTTVVQVAPFLRALNTEDQYEPKLKESEYPIGYIEKFHWEIRYPALNFELYQNPGTMDSSLG